MRPEQENSSEQHGQRPLNANTNSRTETREPTRKLSRTNDRLIAGGIGLIVGGLGFLANAEITIIQVRTELQRIPQPPGQLVQGARATVTAFEHDVRVLATKGDWDKSHHMKDQTEITKAYKIVEEANTRSDVEQMLIDERGVVAQVGYGLIGLVSGLTMVGTALTVNEERIRASLRGTSR